MLDTLIKNANIITMAPNCELIKNGYIGIKGSELCYVGDSMPTEAASEVIDASGGIVMPGLVNAHTHISMTLLRSYADGLPLQDWLFKHIFPIEDRLTPEDIYYGAQLGIMDMIASGVTMFADMYTAMDKVAEAAIEANIKAILCRGLTYFDDSINYSEHQGYLESMELYNSYNNANQGSIRVNFGPHSIYTTTEGFLRFIAERAADLGMSIHIHLSETKTENSDCYEKYGVSPTEYLKGLDFFKTPVLAAHCVHLSDEDIAILKQYNVTAVHNPTSNLKLGSGIAPIPAMLKYGLNVALGTDGAASNNNLNMLEEINLAALIHNGLAQDPTLILAQDALKMATVNGALGLGFGDTGTLQQGKKADLVIINTNKPHLMPMHNPISSIAYSVNSGDVETVMVNGRILYNKGEFKTIDAQRVYYNIEKCKKRIF